MADLVVATAAYVFIFLALAVSGLLFFVGERWPRLSLVFPNIYIGVFSLVIVAAILARRHQGPASIGLVRAPVGRVVLWGFLGLPACYLASALGFLAYVLLTGSSPDAVVAEKAEFFEEVVDFPAAWTLPFSVFVGIHEEIVFRGFGLSRLRVLLRSNAAAIIVCGLVFGVMHAFQGAFGIAQTAAIGMALGAIAVYCRSLWPAMIAHAAFDCLNLLAIPSTLESLHEMADEVQAAALLAWHAT